ncbi:unnamed protein product [Caenorhabditis nigoni]
MPKSTPSKSRESSSTKKRNLKKLILYGIPILLILALVAALIVVLLLGKFGGFEVCKTKECIMLADHLHNWKDDSVDPCQDFFKYSCGKYNEHNVIEGPPITKKTFILKGLIKEFLKKNESSSSKTENAMKHLFSKCEEGKDQSKQAALETAYFQEVRSEAENLGWPMLDPNWDDNSFDLSELLRKISTVGIDERYGINYGIFELLVPGSRKVLIKSNSKPITNFAQVQKVLNAVFPQSSRPAHLNITLEAQNIVWFGWQLATIDASIPQRSDFDVEKNYRQLKAALPDVDFDTLIYDLLSKKSYHMKVRNNVYGYRDFLQKAPQIHTLIQNNKKAAANYFVYQYVQNSFILSLSWKVMKCEEIVAKFLPLPSLRVFIRNHLDKEAIKDVDNLVEDIRSSFIEMLEKSEWLHEKTRSSAIRKAKAMKKTISYPAELERPGALDKHFDIRLDPHDSFYLTMKKIDGISKNLLMDYVTSDFPMGPHFSLMTNAMYAAFDNSINVFAPLMDDPLFHTSFPNYAKIAGIGFIIGHEIGHGFDTGGVNFDENGNPRQWFDVADGPEYIRKAECLINQYNNYDDPSFGRKLHGNITVTEMMADEMGQDVAWRTFKKLDLSQEKKIIGFEDLSFEKLYFQIGATNWCSPRSPLKLEDQLKDPHATDSFRINGLFANEKAFAEAFNCPVGSPMNPVKKCTMF